MLVIDDIARMQHEARDAIRHDARVGFVPTMGTLHEGHLSLIRRSVAENDRTVVSIFVNPSQFNEEADFDAYPRTLEDDLELARAAGVDIVFTPDAKAMYLPGRDTVVQVNMLASGLCGMSRGRGHFIGVCTVVAKLFNIVQPTHAYFGQKDAQQALVLQRMVMDLNIPVTLVVCPTVREEDGLAMSSRNVRLKPENRWRALALYRGLLEGARRIGAGEVEVQPLLQAMAERILEADVDLDYLHVVSPDRLQDVERVEDLVLIAGAVRVDDVRLIDNILVGADGTVAEGIAPPSMPAPSTGTI